MKSNRVFFFVSYGIFSLLLFLVFINFILFSLCFSASRNLGTNSMELMRIKIYGSSSESVDTVSANLTILDMQGSEIATIERSWNGNYLSIDFKSAEFSGYRYYFPLRIYGTQTVTQWSQINRKGSGVSLKKYIFENGECILAGENTDFLSQKNLNILYNFSRSPLSKLFSRFSKKYSVNLFQCEPGKYYGIFINEKGELELSEH